jgi:hypothetical protein
LKSIQNSFLHGIMVNNSSYDFKGFVGSNTM